MWELDISIRSEREAFQEHIGFISERKNAKLRQSLALPGKTCPAVRYSEIVSIKPLGEMDVYDIQTVSGKYLTNSVLVHNCFILSVDDTMESILDWYKVEGMIFKYGSGAGLNLSPIRSSKEQLAGGGTASGPVSFMRAADASAGVIKSGGKTRRAAKMIVLNADHPDVEKFIRCKWEEEKKAWTLVDAGYDASIDGEAYSSIFFQNANNSVRATDEFMKAVLEDKPWDLKSVMSGKAVETVRARNLMRLIAEATWHCGDPGMQFDTTINRWHTLPNTSRINASNPCSEYMSIDDSACNLASLNLMRFVEESGRFRIADFRSAVRTMTIAMDIIVDNSSYPTPRIGENAKSFRELGLGYANLGALLMSLGVPYDSDEGRAYAATVTALMCGEAYRTSAEISAVKGPYAGFAKNREPQLNVIRMHRDALIQVDDRLVPEEMFAAAAHAWEEALRLGTAQGIRNSQVTVLAPTGCLTGNSLVVTNRGLMRLNRLGNPKGAQWQDISFRVATDEGPRLATKFYINGRASTHRIQTEAGYEIQGTPNHRIKVLDPMTKETTWRRLDEVKSGDVVPMAMDSLIGEPQQVSLPPLSEPWWASDENVRAPRTVTPELAEFVGYFMGDGSLHSKGLRFCVTEEDADVAERLKAFSRSLFNLESHVATREGYTEVALHLRRMELPSRGSPPSARLTARSPKRSWGSSWRWAIR
ncbi:MAG: adenosylcobalamin-dependent ribonucleoside-diphosphate reductase [Candidatus Omnitrophica bacterium]|nr:adenosylcobalamin-dependent ribonucleoside-diphosphate reductase [Candidatus Omnitrophota bacterium]